MLYNSVLSYDFIRLSHQQCMIHCVTYSTYCTSQYYSRRKVSAFIETVLIIIIMMIQRWFFLLFLVCNSYLSCSALYHGFRSSLTSCSNHNIIINHRRNIINILSSLSYVLQYRLNPLHSSQQSSSSTSSSSSSSTSSSSSSITAYPVVDEPINVFDKAELIKLFGRLADAKMLLDVPGLVLSDIFYGLTAAATATTTQLMNQ